MTTVYPNPNELSDWAKLFQAAMKVSYAVERRKNEMINRTNLYLLKSQLKSGQYRIIHSDGDMILEKHSNVYGWEYDSYFRHKTRLDMKWMMGVAKNQQQYKNCGVTF